MSDRIFHALETVAGDFQKARNEHLANGLSNKSPEVCRTNASVVLLQTMMMASKGPMALYTDRRKNCEEHPVYMNSTSRAGNAEMLMRYLIGLGAYENWVCVTQAEIQKVLDLSPEYVGYAVRALEECGMRTAKKKTGQFLTTAYTFNRDISDPEPEPGQRKNSPSGINKRRATQLEKYLLSLGAGDRWVRCRNTDICDVLGITLPTIAPVLELLFAEGLRRCRFMTGPLLGCHYTFASLDEPDADSADLDVEKADRHAAEAARKCPKKKPAPPQITVPPVKKVKVTQLPVSKPVVNIEDEVLEQLIAIRERVGSSSFSIDLQRFRETVGFEVSQISNAIRSLADQGEIEITKFTQSTWEYFLHIPEDE